MFGRSFPWAVFMMSMMFFRVMHGRPRTGLPGAAAGGNARAQYRLGLCYRDGNGVLRDKAKAREWLEKAAAQGNTAAAQALAGLA